MAPVHHAAERNDVEALRRLLDEDSGLVEAEDGFFRDRPLHIASRFGSAEAAVFLLDRGADINSRGNVFGESSLMRASKFGHAEVAAVLLARGADPTMATLSDRYTALMYASFATSTLEGSDHVPVIRLLLEDGRSPVDARDSIGATALWLACCYGYTERACVLLVEGRADHTIANNKGVRPAAVAQRHGHQRCVQLLKWYEGELKKAFVLVKARAVVDATESITKAPEKVRAKTEEEAQQAREAAAPAYLRGRVERQEALPSVEVVKQERRRDREGEDTEEERWAVLMFVVTMLKDDLHVELMEGLRVR